MSLGPIELIDVVKSWTFDNADKSIFDRINLALPAIFNFDYPIWSEDYRTVLERKIISHYLTRDIGAETFALWQFYLYERLNLIMPYYNQLYLTTVKDYDYLTDINITKTVNGETDYNQNGTSTMTGTNTNSGTSETDNSSSTNGGSNETTNQTNTANNLHSDLPQANYDNLDYGTGLDKNDSTSDITYNSTINNSATAKTTETTSNTNNSSSNASTTNQNTTKNNLTDTTTGNTGSRSFTNLLVEYRQSLLNIDKMVIDELKDLFYTLL